MLNIALYQPEIPQNTGNIIRLCANSGAQLHLIHPLGFTLDDKRMQRAGLDYHEFATIKYHESYKKFIANNQISYTQKRIFACTTKATTLYTEITYQANDILLLGPETRGLPLEIINSMTAIKIPMTKNSRSLNLSNATAIILYEALRQLGFKNLV